MGAVRFHLSRRSNSVVVFRGNERIPMWKAFRSDQAADAQWLDLSSLEQAQEKLKFKVLSPSELPKDYVLKRATLLQYPSGTVSQSVDLLYQKEHGPDWESLTVSQTAVGDEAALDIKTVENIEHTQVNGHEAIKMETPGGNVTLIWIQEGIACQVSANSDSDARLVAESLG